MAVQSCRRYGPCTFILGLYLELGCSDKMRDTKDLSGQWPNSLKYIRRILRNNHSELKPTGFISYLLQTHFRLRISWFLWANIPEICMQHQHSMSQLKKNRCTCHNNYLINEENFTDIFLCNCHKYMHKTMRLTLNVVVFVHQEG